MLFPFISIEQAVNICIYSIKLNFSELFRTFDISNAHQTIKLRHGYVFQSPSDHFLKKDLIKQFGRSFFLRRVKILYLLLNLPKSMNIIKLPQSVSDVQSINIYNEAIPW